MYTSMSTLIKFSNCQENAHNFPITIIVIQSDTIFDFEVVKQFGTAKMEFHLFQVKFQPSAFS